MYHTIMLFVYMFMPKAINLNGQLLSYKVQDKGLKPTKRYLDLYQVHKYPNKIVCVRYETIT